jgi:hypothetical protein
MLVIEQYILNRNIQRVPSIEVDLTNPYKEINQVTRESTSPPSDSDEDWTTTRKEELIEAYRSNDTTRRASTPHPGKRVKGH